MNISFIRPMPKGVHPFNREIFITWVKILHLNLKSLSRSQHSSACAFYNSQQQSRGKKKQITKQKIGNISSAACQLGLGRPIINSGNEFKGAKTWNFGAHTLLIFMAGCICRAEIERGSHPRNSRKILRNFSD